MLVSDSIERIYYPNNIDCNVFMQGLIVEYFKNFKRKVFIDYELSDRLFI